MLAELQLEPRVTVSKPAETVSFPHSSYLTMMFVFITSDKLLS